LKLLQNSSQAWQEPFINMIEFTAQHLFKSATVFSDLEIPFLLFEKEFREGTYPAAF
jgi:hypothetical protein